MRVDELVGFLIEGQFKAAQLAVIDDVGERREPVGGTNGILARGTLPRHALPWINAGNGVCSVQISLHTDREQIAPRLSLSSI